MNQLREIAHVSLTALARSAQRTGFYERSFDALALGAALTILTGIRGNFGGRKTRSSRAQNIRACAGEFEQCSARAGVG